MSSKYKIKLNLFKIDNTYRFGPGCHLKIKKTRSEFKFVYAHKVIMKMSDKS